MESELVSVIIPAYGRPDRTQRAVESVAQQTYGPLELFVVDDGSTPPLADSLTLPTDRLDHAELIRLDENQGANVARNTGIKAATGEFIAFLDSDDEWKPEKTTRQIEAIQASDARASYMARRQVNADGELTAVSPAPYSGDLRPHLLAENVIGTFSSLVIRQDTVSDVGLPDPELPCWQDWEWYLRLCTSVHFVGIDEPLVIRHNEGSQISHSFRPKRERAFPVLRSRLLDVAESPQEEKIALAGLRFRLGYAALSNDEYPTARSCFARAIRQRPFTAKYYPFLAVAGPHYRIAQQLKRSAVQLAH